MKEPIIEIHTEAQNNRQDALWFCGKEKVASFELNGSQFFAVAEGETRIDFGADPSISSSETVLTGEDAMKFALDQNFNDNDITRISDNDGLIHAGWFRIEKHNLSGEVEDLEVAGYYDDAIELLKNVAEEEAKKKVFFKTTFQLEVLSESPIPKNMTLEDITKKTVIGSYTSEKEFVGNLKSEKVIELDTDEVSRKLEEFGSEPSFFSISE